MTPFATGMVPQMIAEHNSYAWESQNHYYLTYLEWLLRERELRSSPRLISLRLMEGFV